jgi:hypothetical protein
MNLLSYIATIYEEKYYPVKTPTLSEVFSLGKGELQLD